MFKVVEGIYAVEVAELETLHEALSYIEEHYSDAVEHCVCINRYDDEGYAETFSAQEIWDMLNKEG